MCIHACSVGQSKVAVVTCVLNAAYSSNAVIAPGVSDKVFCEV